MNKKDINFFTPIPDEDFENMQNAIEAYDKKSDSVEAEKREEDEGFTTEMLIELSRKKLAEPPKP